MENSTIEWTDHTVNPWIGCTKISPGCRNCYAATQNRRFGRDNWGPDKPRRLLGADNWQKPMRWNRRAAGVAALCRDKQEFSDWTKLRATIRR